MSRIFLTYLIPFLLPIAVWFAWHKFFAKPPAPGEETGVAPRQAPWHWLGLAGLVLLMATLGMLAVFSGGHPGDVYHPPQMIDGKIVPGYHNPADRH